MIPPNTLLLSSFIIQQQHRQRHPFVWRGDISYRNNRCVYPSSLRLDNNDEIDITKIEGLVSDEKYNHLVAVDKTLRSLQLQLPAILTKPLTPSTIEEIYSKDNFSLSVLVDDNDSNTNNDDNLHDVFQGNGTEIGILILNNREELIALSDVLVLTTVAAQQAILVTGLGQTDTRVQIECQLIINDSCSLIRIPWRAKTPTLGSLSSAYNSFEGITDCYLSTPTSSKDDEDGVGIGKVERFVIKKATFNGRTLNGPAIGQALKSIQSTVSNMQQNSIIQNIVGVQQGEDNRATNFINTLRDGVLAGLSSSVVNDDDDANFDPQNTTVPIYQVKSIEEVPNASGNGWIDEKSSSSSSLLLRPPCPGTKDWEEYVDSRSCLIRFSNDIIPKLSDLSIVDPKLFTNDVTYKLADGTILMTGRDSLANFYQSMALTRKGTRGIWMMDRCKVIDWNNRIVAITYTVTINSLPQWNIRGRDIYVLDTNSYREDRPIINEIRQGKMIAVGPNGNKIQLDGRWLVDNIAAAFQQKSDDNGSVVKVPRDFLTELLMNQPTISSSLRKQKSASASKTPSITETNSRKEKKISKSAAAACYYIMTDLYEEGLLLFDLSSNNRSPPAFEHLSENIELRGYLGESIVRGSSLYSQSIESVIFGIRESIRQKRLLIEEDKIVYPRVELLVPTGEIRLSLTFLFRIPPPGAGIIIPSSSPSPSPDSPITSSASLPLKVEFVSDYRIDFDTGLIEEHRLVETRVNGQLSAGDQVSRWIQRFLKLDGSSATTSASNSGNEDGTLKAISDALLWFRSR